MTSKEYKKQKRISNRMKRKLALMFVVIVLALVGLSVRIVYINKTNGDKYTKKVDTLSDDKQKEILEL